jgi:uncharacterized protein YyaL (SSP411 family)
VQEFAVVGDPASAATKEALRAIRQGFHPHRVVALKPTAGGGPSEETIPLLAGKTAQGAVTTYICRNFSCEAPLVGVEALRAALKK